MAACGCSERISSIHSQHHLLTQQCSSSGNSSNLQSSSATDFTPSQRVYVCVANRKRKVPHSTVHDLTWPAQINHSVLSEHTAANLLRALLCRLCCQSVCFIGVVLKVSICCLPSACIQSSVKRTQSDIKRSQAYAFFFLLPSHFQFELNFTPFGQSEGELQLPVICAKSS